MSICIHGTLVIVIPTKDGLIFAADSRSTISGQHFDNREKIKLVKNHDNFVFSITGTSEFISAPPQLDYELSEWLLVAPKEFDGAEIISNLLAQETTINNNNLLAIANSFNSEISRFLNSKPEIKSQYLGNELCRVVLASYDFNKSYSIIGTFVISISSSGIINFEKNEISELSKKDKLVIKFYGEDEYVLNNVLNLNSLGRNFLNYDTRELFTTLKFIKQMSYLQAAKFSYSVINATSETSKLIPIPSGNGIGGIPNIFLINGKDKPKKITYKK